MSVNIRSSGLFLRTLALLQSKANAEKAVTPNRKETIELLQAIEAIGLEGETSFKPANRKKTPRLPVNINSQGSNAFPLVMIDKKMKIIFKNEACVNLFAGYVNISGEYFMEAFAKPFGIKDIRQIRETILGRQNGYFWKGEIDIKSKTETSLHIKVFVFPREIEAKNPGEFIVLFEDISEEKKRLTRATFLSLLEASKLKDQDTGNHSERVNLYSRRLSEELFRSSNIKYNRINADFIDDIGFLAAMHDLGKIGTPDDILNKEGSLEDWQWKIMQQHTINGGIILNSYPNKMAQEIARCHHEHWDGSGYPYQLSEESIPLAARIVTIADVYDALRMERSYKPAFSHKTSVQKIVEGKGSHFDPFLVHAFIYVEKDFDRIYEENCDDTL